MSRLSTPFRYIRESVFHVGTQADFADMLGYTQAQVSRLERGERRISRDAQDRIRGLATAKKSRGTTLGFSKCRLKNAQHRGGTGKVDVETLRKILEYNPETGVFTRRTSLRNRPNEIAGTTSRFGYVKINVLGRTYSAHRLAWLYVYGRDPLGEIDHINARRDDNRICNLREATRSQNHANRMRQSTNTSGHKGVYRVGERWYARITVNKRNIPLGTYSTFGEAVAAYTVGARKHYGEFARPE